MKNWMWSKISSGATPKNLYCIALPPDSKAYVFLYKKQIIWLQSGRLLIFYEVQPEMFVKFKDF